MVEISTRLTEDSNKDTLRMDVKCGYVAGLQLCSGHWDIQDTRADWQV